MWMWLAGGSRRRSGGARWWSRLVRSGISVADQRGAQALELYLAGASSDAIAETVGYKSGGAALEVVRQAIGDGPVAAELARLDALLTGLWANARRGDVQAVDRVLHIGDRRIKLLA